MKLSKYNIYRKFDNSYYLINVLNSSFIELSKEIFDKLPDMDIDALQEIYPDLTQRMAKNGMLIENNIDELSFLKNRYIEDQNSKDLLTITIAPTLCCNFECPYCYEDKNGKTIDEEEQKKIIDFIAKQLSMGYNKLNLIWFGGEPLMVFDIIKNMSTEIIQLCEKYDVDYNAFLTTNGYLLTDDVVRCLKDLSINQLYITLDGPEHIHDQRRCLHGGKPTFATIVENAVNAKNNGINTVIRMNIDRTNAPYIEELRNFITNELGLPMYLGLVREYTESCNNEKGSYFSKQEYADIEDEFYERQDKDIDIDYPFPRQKPVYCRAAKIGTFVIDPYLDLFKCENDIGRQDKRISTVDDYSFINEIASANNKSYYTWNPFEYEECNECDILPICMGGCPFIGIKNQKPECETYKYNFDTCIKRHILKKTL